MTHQAQDCGSWTEGCWMGFWMGWIDGWMGWIPITPPHHTPPLSVYLLQLAFAARWRIYAGARAPVLPRRRDRYAI